MNVNEAALAADLTPKAVRYYEAAGLVVPPRAANGYRHYEDSHVHQLRFVGRARALGFSVDESRALLDLYNDRGRASAEVKALAKTHRAEIDRKMAELQSMADTLDHLIENCSGDDRPDCPILSALEGK